jgi:hypothetical protein
MSKGKFVIILMMATFVLATTAAPTSAFFKAETFPIKQHGVIKTGTSQITIVGAGTFECTDLRLFSKGQQGRPITEAGSSQQKFAAAYSHCLTKAGGAEGEGKVNMNQCQYNFHQAKGALTGQISIECPPGAKIKFVTGVLGCEIEFGEAGNTFLPGITYADVNSEKEIEETTEVAGITEIANAGCEIGGIKSGKESKYEGITIISAQKDVPPFEQVGIKIV